MATMSTVPPNHPAPPSGELSSSMSRTLAPSSTTMRLWGRNVPSARGVRDPRDERAVNLDPRRHVEERPARPGGQRLSPQAGVRGRRRARPEVPPHEVGVLACRGGEVGEDDAAVDEPRVGKERPKLGVGEQVAVARHLGERRAAPLLLLPARPAGLLGAAPPGDAQVAEPVGLATSRAEARDRRRVERSRRRRGHRSGLGHPTAPSIWSWMRRFISTAYSIGSSLTIGSMKPFTIMALASASVRPRLMR